MTRRTSVCSVSVGTVQVSPMNISPGSHLRGAARALLAPGALRGDPRSSLPRSDLATALQPETSRPLRPGPARAAREPHAAGRGREQGAAGGRVSELAPLEACVCRFPRLLQGKSAGWRAGHRVWARTSPGQRLRSPCFPP